MLQEGSPVSRVDVQFISHDAMICPRSVGCVPNGGDGRQTRRCLPDQPVSGFLVAREVPQHVQSQRQC